MAAPVYPPLPVPPGREPEEGAAHYGARLFAWLAGPLGCTAMVPTEDLELASYAGVLAVTGYPGKDATDQDRAILASLSHTRHMLAAIIAGRNRETADAAQLAALVTRTPQLAGPQGNDRPNEGPMAPLLPRPITRPPGGQGAALPVPSGQFGRTDNVQF
jgi:hypothetical protein